MSQQHQQHYQQRAAAPPRQVGKRHTAAAKLDDLPEDTSCEPLLLFEGECPAAPLDPVTPTRPPTPRPPTPEHRQQQQQQQPQQPPQQQQPPPPQQQPPRHTTAPEYQFAEPDVHPSRLAQAGSCQVQIMTCMWSIGMIHKETRSFLEGAIVARECPGRFLRPIVLVPLGIARDWCRYAMGQCKACLRISGTAVERSGGLTDVLIVVLQDLKVVLDSIQATVNFVLCSRLDPRGAPEDFASDLRASPITYQDAVRIENLAHALYNAFVGECNRCIDGLTRFVLLDSPYRQERAVPVPPSSRPPSPRRPTRKRAATPPV
mmetsp:Transcript_12163/g.34398  ORF Transcript_12163/g.34398 Transcript_12163/m.34398 type:complete len:318 (+) Transcript_12163:1737-2690(+)